MATAKLSLLSVVTASASTVVSTANAVATGAEYLGNEIAHIAAIAAKENEILLERAPKQLIKSIALDEALLEKSIRKQLKTSEDVESYERILQELQALI